MHMHIDKLRVVKNILDDLAKNRKIHDKFGRELFGDSFETHGGH